MTKRVHIINGDNSNWPVKLTVMAPGVDGSPDRVVRELDVGAPGNVVAEYIHSGQYLIVSEAKIEPK